MNESTEMYLETILLLSRNKENIKAIDISKHLNYSKPSVSNAMTNLKNKELIIINNNDITLTNKGLKLALNVYDKHKTITSFLIKTLNLDENEAELNACKIEHVITSECFDKMKEYVK